MIFTLFFLLFFSQALAQQPNTFVTRLNKQVKETSGLVSLNGKLITHNDSGGKPWLYEVNPGNGAITRVVILDNATNIDWEDICHDGEFIYIGDFGNNAGARKDLVIYKIRIEDYLQRQQVEVEKIRFRYAEQTDFRQTRMQTNFDAESLIAYGDSLYLFTKNWGNQQTSLYAIPKLPGNYTVKSKGSLPVNALLTGAHYDETSGSVWLTAYTTSFRAFLVEIKDTFSGSFSSREFNRYNIKPDQASTQIEAIAPTGEAGIYYISSEEQGRYKAALQRVKVSALK